MAAQSFPNAAQSALTRTARAVPSAAAEPLLEIRNLTVQAKASGKRVIDNLSLRINKGEVVALVGESGSGKSMTALSLVRLLPRGLAISGGEIRFGGQDVMAMSERELNHLRGGEMAMLFQQPQAMLDPTSRVREQVAEPLRWHRQMTKHTAFRKVVDLMRNVGISDAEVRSRSYCHQLSGGMAQRVMIATAMGPEPKLLIADEPTTALDVTVQAQILALMDAERRAHDLSILLITHDLTIVSAFSDRVAVMYAGRIVEEGETEEVMRNPQHPYTRALIRCSLMEPEADGRLLSIPGSGAQASELKQGCRFLPRCQIAHPAGLDGHCGKAEPELKPLHDTHLSRCHAHDHDHATS